MYNFSAMRKFRCWVQFKNIMKQPDWNNTRFHEDATIAWPCPNCNNPALTFDKKKFIHDETVETKDMQKNEEYWEFEWITYNVTGAFICNNCKNQTMFTGTATVQHYQGYDQFTDEYEEGYYKVYEPLFFQPPLNIFIIAENCPETVKDEIINSFRLFWFDLSSCANKIRVALEILMDTQKVKKTSIVSGKKKRITLHNRILEFKKKNAEVASYLEAIKWIGNSGSHIGTLERVDILEAYQLLEFSLQKLFSNKESEIKKITKEIIARKGIRKRK